MLVLLGLLPALPVAGEEAPRLVYASMLNSVDYYTQTGALRFAGTRDKDRTLRGVGFPDALRNDQQAIKTVLKGKDGSVIREFNWRLITDQRLTPVGIGKAPELKGAGEYTLEFLLKDQLLAKIALVTEAGDGGTYLDGPWADWGYVSFKDGSPDSPVSFHGWFRSKGAKGKKAAVKVVLLKGKKAIATTNKDLFFNSQWGERSVVFDQGRFKAKDLLKDGAYTFRVTVDGAAYGSYPLTVKGGKIDQADAAGMEGGGELFYLKRQK
jgi:hypothetical protein